mmetsp:Transcript_25575/g.39613  ORF Transcript_25575/g.39613 Transcript_25575/m.39613 type:complete len:506 (-) Transcript_25575:489-2006(-)|eukprot:CAMPEP_0196812348 /NCGR_PEP_ID=MMETSP1362-20130617/24484_1 /TAXON_ID=163516 /ORGANISM="Leptocylindrus danicus, Strain CCMP1856" /LENGTH=505 /DNA_ID=CAMNT_0042187937 /DNA_START=242 /DNA_END=1759 /DNA_ORIENTATION=-
MEAEYKAALNRIDVLENQLSDADSKSRYKIREKLCEKIAEIVLKYPHFCVDGVLVGKLWTICFYKRIGELRLQVSKCKKKMKSAAAEEKALQKFIGDGMIFFKFLLERLEKPEIKYRLMLNLGDLCRYSSDNKKAEEFYLKASNLAPKSGICYNQIAVVNQLNKYYINSLYYYVRALTATEKFEFAKSNMKRVFDDIRSQSETERTKQFILDLLGIMERYIKREAAIDYRHVMSDFFDILKSKNFGEFLLLKINVVLIYLSSTNIDLFDLLIDFNGAILDVIISTEVKKIVKYLGPVVVFLDFMIQNNLVEKAEKYCDFVDKIKSVHKKYSVSSEAPTNLFLKEHLHLRGFGLISYKLDDLEYEFVLKNLASEEVSTIIRLNRLKNFYTLINLEDSLAVDMDISPKEHVMIDDKPVESMDVDKIPGETKDPVGDDESFEDDDVIVFKPEQQPLQQQKIIPPPPGFAPITTINPFLIQPEDDIPADPEDPMNVVGMLFGGSINPFI